MAQLLGPIQKRDILYGVKRPQQAELSKLAQDFESEGWFSDALDFSQQAGDKDKIKKLKDLARDEGNTFLFLKSLRVLAESPDNNSDLKKCAEMAESLGKIRYAIMAYEKLGDLDRVENLKQKISNDLDIQSELQSRTQVFIPEHAEELEGDEPEDS